MKIICIHDKTVQTNLANRDCIEMSRTLILLTVPLWLTRTTCSSLSPSSVENDYSLQLKLQNILIITPQNCWQSSEKKP